MEISAWLPSAVALLVGIGSVLISNFFIDNREKRKARDRRTEAMKEYAHALLEWHLYHFSGLGVGAGNHPMPSRERLTECARKFYPYLHEFKGDPEYGNLMSPYPEQFPYSQQSDDADFYSKLHTTVERHLQKYPKKSPRNAYEKKKK